MPKWKRKWDMLAREKHGNRFKDSALRYLLHCYIINTLTALINTWEGNKKELSIVNVTITA